MAPSGTGVVLGEAPVQLVVALAADVADLEARRPGQLPVEGQAPRKRPRLLVVRAVHGLAAEDHVSSAQSLEVAQAGAAAGDESPDAVGQVDRAAVGRRRVGIPVDAEAAAHDRLAGAGHVPGEAHARRHEHRHPHPARRHARVFGVPHHAGEIAGRGFGAVAALVPDDDAVVPRGRRRDRSRRRGRRRRRSASGRASRSPAGSPRCGGTRCGGARSSATPRSRSCCPRRRSANVFPVLFQPQLASASRPLLGELPGCLLTTCSQKTPAFSGVVPPHLGHVLLDAPLPLRREQHGVEASVVCIDRPVVAEEAGVDRRDLVVALPEDTPVGIAHGLAGDGARVVDHVPEVDVREGEQRLAGQGGVEHVGQADASRSPSGCLRAAGRDRGRLFSPQRPQSVTLKGWRSRCMLYRAYSFVASDRLTSTRARACQPFWSERKLST